MVDRNAKYTNTVYKAGIGIYRNVFGIIINNLDDYEEETHRQTKCATYKEIQAWVKQKYDLHVSGTDIALTKEQCGLKKNAYKGRKASGKYLPPKLRPDKEAAIREAFIAFGLI